MIGVGYLLDRDLLAVKEVKLNSVESGLYSFSNKYPRYCAQSWSKRRGKVENDEFEQRCNDGKNDWLLSIN